MTKKTWILFAVMCLVLLGGLVYLSRDQEASVETVDVSKQQTPNDQNGQIGDHTLGNKDAKVVVVEYADYQCPGCRSASPAIKKAVEKNSKDVLLIFRNLPLSSIHPNARAAAAAAEAAGLQGKFWEMHAKLFENQLEWNNASPKDRTGYFSNYSDQLGLDTDKFKKDLGSKQISDKINYDLALAKKLNLTATPSVFVNGDSLGEQIAKDNPGADTKSIGSVWSSPEIFEKYSLKPAIEKHKNDK